MASAKAIDCVQGESIGPLVPSLGVTSDDLVSMLPSPSTTTEWKVRELNLLKLLLPEVGCLRKAADLVDDGLSQQPEKCFEKTEEEEMRLGRQWVEEEERRRNRQWRWKMKRMRPAWRMCDAMLVKLMNHENAQVFVDPVESSALGPDPLTLMVVKQKLDRRLYFSPLTFYAEVRLVFDSFMRGHPSCRVRLQALALQVLGEKEFLEVDAAIEDIVDAYDPDVESENEDGSWTWKSQQESESTVRWQ